MKRQLTLIALALVAADFNGFMTALFNTGYD
jgi:hypothetical protein